MTTQKTNKLHNPIISINPKVAIPGVCQDLSLVDALEKIREGKWEKEVKRVAEFVKQNPDDTQGKQELKENLLPVLTLNGNFKYRNNETKNLIEASGILTIDADGFKSQETAEQFRDGLRSNPDVYFAFLSPSYKGVKYGVKIPIVESDAEYKLYYEGYLRKWNKGNVSKHLASADKIDHAADLCRACYVSYDPNLYFNADSSVFNEPISPEESDSELFENPKVTPDAEYFNDGLSIEDKVDRILDFNYTVEDKEKGKTITLSYKEGMKNDLLLQVGVALRDYGIPVEYAQRVIKERFVEDDRGAVKNKGRINSIYNNDKENRFGTKTFKKKSSGASPSKSGKFVGLEPFWYMTKLADGKEKVAFDPLAFSDFFLKAGYRKFYRNDTSEGQPVQVKNNIVRISSYEQMKDFTMEYLGHIGKQKVIRHFKIMPGIFGKATLNFIEVIEIKKLQGEKNKDYLFYQNGVLEVTSKNLVLKNYTDFDNYIWDSHIQNRDFNIDAVEDNMFGEFLAKVSNDNGEALRTAFGYAVCTHKDRSNSKAVILYDADISDDPQGRSGKGIIFQAIGKHRNVKLIDGKTWKPDSSFPYQGIDLDTHAIFFDDMKRNFKFEVLFSIITEGITIEKKGKDSFVIESDESPKVFGTSNYVLSGDGDSFEGRIAQWELKKVYSAKKTPQMDFGCLLFDDWNEDEWTRFDMWSAKSLQLFLNGGIILQEDTSTDLKKFRLKTSQEFQEWVDGGAVSIGVKYYRTKIKDEFVSAYADEWEGKDKRGKELLSGKRFAIWMNALARYKGWGQIGPTKDNRDRDGGRYFYFTDPNKEMFPVEEEEERTLPFDEEPEEDLPW